LVSLHDLPWACSPCPMKASKSLAPINGLLILLEPMRIENKLPSNWVYDENSWAQWDTRNIPSSNQIGWQSSWLMGLEDSSFPLSWISWWGLLSLILILSVRWHSHPTSSS
jgi:hypothetical protein